MAANLAAFGSNPISTTGNITAGNLIISGAIIDSGQLDIQTSAGNANIVLTPNGTGNVNVGRISASGNITASYFIGNGSQLTGIATGSSSNIVNGTSNITIVSSGGNATVSIGGTSNVAVFATTGAFVTGLISATGNVIANNGMFTTIVNTASHTGAVVSVTGNITGSNVITGTLNVTGVSNLGAVGNVRITGGSNTQILSTDGTGNLSWISSSSLPANITVNNFTGNGVQTAFTLGVTPSNINETTVNYDGIVQLRSAYSLAGSVLTFSEAPAAGSLIEVTTTKLIAGSGGTPGGSNTQVQFNDAGAFGGSAGFTFDKTSNAMIVTGNVSGGNLSTAGALTVTGTATTGNITVLGAIKENVYTITDGASVDLDPVNGTVQLWTLAASRTPTANNFVAGQSMTLMINSGAFAVTWTSIPVTWVGNTAPTLGTPGYNVIELWEVGNTVYGASIGLA